MPKGEKVTATININDDGQNSQTSQTTQNQQSTTDNGYQVQYVQQPQLVGYNNYGQPVYRMATIPVVTRSQNGSQASSGNANTGSVSPRTSSQASQNQSQNSTKSSTNQKASNSSSKKNSSSKSKSSKTNSKSSDKKSTQTSKTSQNTTAPKAQTSQTTPPAPAPVQKPTYQKGRIQAAADTLAQISSSLIRQQGQKLQK